MLWQLFDLTQFVLLLVPLPVMDKSNECFNLNLHSNYNCWHSLKTSKMKLAWQLKSARGSSEVTRLHFGDHGIERIVKLLHTNADPVFLCKKTIAIQLPLFHPHPPYTMSRGTSSHFVWGVVSFWTAWNNYVVFKGIKRSKHRNNGYAMEYMTIKYLASWRAIAIKTSFNIN